MEENLRPRIRFRGFTEPWKQCPLTDKASLFGGLTYSPNDIQSNGTLVLRSSNVQHGEIVSAKDDVYVNNDVVNVSNVCKGDIIVVVRNGSRALIGKHAAIKHEYPNTVIGAFMSGLRYEHSEFLNALLSTNHFVDEINKNLGATINQITGGNFKEMKFFFPTENEQINIGQVFFSLDETILSKQEELEKLENVKKACMERMFPQEGEIAPQLRFKGFTKKWERCQLNTVCSYHTSALTIADAIEGGLYPLYDANGQIGFYNQCIQEEYISIIKDGSGVGRTRIMPKLSYIIGTMGAIKAHKEIDVYYLYCLISNINFSEFINGATIPHVYFRDYGDAYVAIPSFDEQQKIGAYFRHLDDLIAAKRQEIEKLQNIKQSLLDKMFV